MSRKVCGFAFRVAALSRRTYERVRVDGWIQQEVLLSIGVPGTSVSDRAATLTMQIRQVRWFMSVAIPMQFAVRALTARQLWQADSPFAARFILARASLRRMNPPGRLPRKLPTTSLVP